MKNKLDKKGANMKNVNFITYRTASGVMQMHEKLAATKFLLELLPATNCQGNVKKKNRLLKYFLKTIKIRCAVYCKIRMFPLCFQLAFTLLLLCTFSTFPVVL